jgi:hypothetical protein
MRNPQSWNLFAYSFNNPLRYTDPTGNEVQAADCYTLKECEKALNAVKGALGNAAAAGRVSLVAIERGFFSGLSASITGAPQFRFAISGDLSSFAALGANASHFADLVKSSKVATVAIAETYHRNGGGEPSAGGGIGLTPSLNYDPSQAVVSPRSSTFDPDTAGIINHGFGTIPGANPAEGVAHELLGHIWSEIIGGHNVSTLQNYRDAVDAENVRATDPARGLKTRHHDAPPLFAPQELQRMMR